MQRVILNVQKIKHLDELGVRKLVAAFIRPQKSGIYGATGETGHQFEGTYLPKNVQLCPTEKEVAENFGPFLFQKDEVGRILTLKDRSLDHSKPGKEFERRRSKRMHVAIPVDLVIHPNEQERIATKAIATNISEGGMYVEYLDLDALKTVETLEPVDGLPVEIEIHPSNNFPEEYHLDGEILRREVRNRNLGLAVTFIQK